MHCHLERALEGFSGKEGCDRDCKSKNSSGRCSDVRQESGRVAHPGQPVLLVWKLISCALHGEYAVMLGLLV